LVGGLRKKADSILTDRPGVSFSLKQLALFTQKQLFMQENRHFFRRNLAKIAESLHHLTPASTFSGAFFSKRFVGW
jgi:hypothetical protein